MIAALSLPRVFWFLFNWFWIDMTSLVTYRQCRASSAQASAAASLQHMAEWRHQSTSRAWRNCKIATNALEMPTKNLLHNNLDLFYFIAETIFWSSWSSVDSQAPLSISDFLTRMIVLVVNRYCRDLPPELPKAPQQETFICIVNQDKVCTSKRKKVVEYQIIISQKHCLKKDL